MKKIILLSLLFSSILFAGAKPYIGFAYGMTEESFTSVDATNSSQFLNAKAGYGIREAYSVEIELEYVKNRSKIFSSGDTQYDGDKYSLDVSLLKAFDFNIYVLPFIKAGFGAGFMKIDRVLDDRLSFGSYNAGTGIFIPVNQNFDFELGYKFRYYSYEGLDLISEQVVHTSQTHSPYIGINIRY